MITLFKSQQLARAEKINQKHEEIGNLHFGQQSEGRPS